MANVTVTTAANFIPEVWSNDILDIVKANLVLVPRVSNYSADVKSKGDTIHVPTVTEISATAKTAGTDVTATANTESKVDISLDQYFYAAVKIEDIVKTQSQADMKAIYTRAIGYAITKKMDTTLAALGAAFSQTTGTTNTALTDAVILSSIVYLDNANAPMQDRHFVIKPQAKADILALDKFVLFQNTGAVSGGSRVMNGNLGEIYGVEVAVTTQIQQSASPVTNENMMFQKDALAIAKQSNVRVQAQYKLESLADLLVADAIWGVKEMRDTFGVLVKS